MLTPPYLTDIIARIMFAILAFYYSITKRSKDAIESYPDLVKLADNFSKIEPFPDVLYFGDSVLLRISNTDDEPDTLVQLVAKNLRGKLNLIDIAHTAYHMQIYKHLIKVLDTTTTKPKMVILPINLRSFSPQWDFYPSWQFDSEIRAIKKYLANPNSDIPSVGEISMTPTLFNLFDSIPIKYPLTDYKYIGQFRNSIKSQSQNEEMIRFRLKNIFIFHYMHPLRRNHRKLTALVESLQLLRDMGIAILIYVTPINYQAGKKYVGQEFIKSIQSNVQTIIERIAPYQTTGVIQFLDYSAMLESNCFFSETNATEHLNQNGRKILADRIASVILNEVQV